MNSDEYSRVLHEFYEIYLPASKRYGLRMWSHFDIYGNNSIEIWRCDKNTGKKLEVISRAKQNDSTACYREAIRDLQHYDERYSQKHRAIGYAS